MPTTRKSSRLSSGGKQSTLSFNHKVTKSVPKSAKDAVHKSSSLSKEFPVTEIKKREVEEEDVKPPRVHSEDEAEEKQDVVAPTPTHAPAEKTDAELRAARISDASIERYWRKIEDSRMAKAVHKKHTEGLSTGEKVLRYFDVSSQYGPCVGIARLKRWQRADRLGLNPPIEVLAVLLKEEARGNKDIERAHMDELLNSTAVGGA